MARQITLTGKTTYDPGTKTYQDGDLHLTLDDQGGKLGQPITPSVYNQLTADYLNIPQQQTADEILHYVIDKQLLFMVLSSANCKGLMLSKCRRPDGTESIAVAAVDGDQKLLGAEDPENFFGVEWIGIMNRGGILEKTTPEKTTINVLNSL